MNTTATQCVTYTNGTIRIAISAEQEQMLKAAGFWVRDQHGELCQVQKGSHYDYPTLSDSEIEQVITGTHARFGRCNA